MKICHLKIRNFRGIKTLTWGIPGRNIFCLIGKGDSTKSTILEAIRYAFYPQWNLSFDDADFHNCDITNEITIEATIGNLIPNFLSLTKYGAYLRGWDNENRTLVDEPDDEIEKVLTIRLKVARDMEPRWHVINNRNPEGVEFKSTDRQKVCVGIIGAYSERQLSWSSGTALSRLTEENDLSVSLADASRNARISMDSTRASALKNFDEAAKKSEFIAKALGVPVKDSYKAHLDINSINIKLGGLSLHDGDMPLRQLGLGSRRMLLCGIQKLSLSDGHITLFDELEFGLEPHRIARLIKHIRDDSDGQYFATTHSPIVLRELSISDLYIVRNENGVISITEVSDESLSDHGLQGKIRSYSEAFLAKKIIICEGATEVGFLRGFDDYLSANGDNPFSFHGTALVNVGGAKNIKTSAKAFLALHYPVGVLADGDAPSNFSKADEDELSRLGANVQVWNEDLSLEERAMRDLPWQQIITSVILARDEFDAKVQDNVCSALKAPISSEIIDWPDSENLRKAIGAAAKKSEWFKSTSKGARWFEVISPAFSDPKFLKSDLFIKLAALREWIKND